LYPLQTSCAAALCGSEVLLFLQPRFLLLLQAKLLGLPALLGLLAIPAALWVRRARPTDTATWAALAGIGLDALTQDVEDFRHVWVLLGLADAHRSPITDH